MVSLSVNCVWRRLVMATVALVMATLLLAVAGKAGAVDLDLLTQVRQLVFGEPEVPKSVLARDSARIDVALTAADEVWFDDVLPAGSVQAGLNEAWSWVSSEPAPFSGTLSHRSASVAGLHQHYFYGASTPLVPVAGDTLFVYVYLDPANPPAQVMVQWNDGSWEHRAYWGANLIDWGSDGTASRRGMGELPPLGQWVRLEVPAALVGLEGRPINGMAFTLHGGRASWDAAGKTAQVSISGTVLTGGVPLAGVAVDAGPGTTCSATSATGHYTCTVSSGYSGAVTPALHGYAFSPASRAYSSLVSSQVGQDFTAMAAAVSEVVWVEDALPPGSTPAGSGEGWSWTSTAPAPYSGALAHVSALAAGMHQHYFTGASNPLQVGVGETLFTYVYLDPSNPPTQVMLQWNDGTWEHRAYWGMDQIPWGAAGTASRRYMGPLPKTGVWVRLEAPAAQVGLEGRSVNGMAFTLYGGRAFWDRAGKLTSSPSTHSLSGRVSVAGSPLGGIAVVGTNGASCTGTDPDGRYICTVPANWSGTLSPVQSGFGFTPAARTYAGVTSSQVGQDFVAIAENVQIAGTVNLDGSPLAGVAMTGSGGASCTVTDAGGRFSCSVTYNWSGSIAPSKDGHAFVPASRAYSNITVGQVGQDFAATSAAPAEVVWVEDAAPPGSVLAGEGESWSWISSNPAPYSGALAHASAARIGLHQHFFYGATDPLRVNSGDTLFTYIYLDPANPPTQVMLQWNDGSWEHRAYWGANQIGWGVDGTASRRYMGPLPATGSWVRLEVPASQVGLEERSVNGMAFTLFGGRAVWDRAGKLGGSPAATHLLTGRVLAGGVPLGDVPIQATLGALCSATDSAGQFSCTVPAGWSGTIGPLQAGYAWTPAARTYTAVSAGQSGQDFVGTPSTYQVSGIVSLGGLPLAGVNLVASNGGACTATDALGRYGCTVPAGWTGSVVPSLTGHVFAPASRSYGGVAANQAAQDFTASAASYAVTGTVRVGGVPFAGVVVQATNGVGCTSTNALGQYSCTVPFNWTGAVSPILAGHAFVPASRSYSNVVNQQSAQDYAGSAIMLQIGGTVTAGAGALQGVTLNVTNGGSCTTSDASGAYLCTVPSGWSGAVTPNMIGYGFTPSSRSYAAVTASALEQGFLATPSGSGAPVLVGSAASPADGVPQVGPVITVQPPSGMAAGDLMVLIVQAPLVGTRDALVDSHGGQEWSAFDATFPPNFGSGVRIFWARFSGNWTSSLTVRSPGWTTTGQPITALLQVYRASAPGKWWVPDNWGYRTHGFDAPSSPGNVTLPGITTVKSEAVSLAVWASPGTVGWSDLAGPGWSRTGLPQHVRNPAGAGLSMATAYQLRTTPGPTGDVSLRQTGGAVEGAYIVVSFAAVELPQGGAVRPVARVQSKSMQGGGSKTLSLTLDAPVTSGNMIVGYVYFETWHARIRGPIVDDMGNEYTVIHAANTTEVTQIGVMFFRPNITNAPRTITVTVEGANALFSGMLAHEVSGRLALDAYTGDWLPPGDGFAPGVISTRQIAPTMNGAYIFCVAETVAQSPPVPYFDFSAWASSPWIEQRVTSDSSNTFASADLVQPIAAPIACTASVPYGRTAFILMAAFRPF